MAIYTSRLLDSNVRMDSRKRQYIQLLVREKDPGLSRLFSEIFDGYYDEHDDYLDPREIDKLIKLIRALPTDRLDKKSERRLNGLNGLVSPGEMQKLKRGKEELPATKQLILKKLMEYKGSLR